MTVAAIGLVHRATIELNVESYRRRTVDNKRSRQRAVPVDTERCRAVSTVT